MMGIPLIAIISGLMTIGVRLSGLMLFAPFFGGAVIPARIKAGLVLSLTLLLFPTVGKNIGAYSLTDWPIMIFTEFSRLRHWRGRCSAFKWATRW
jgi:flagellar biosynthetic protein FliR